MKIEQIIVFVRLYSRLSPPVRKKVVFTVRRLAMDMHHPSLHVRKLVNHNRIYEARVDFHFRITFRKTDDTFVLRKVGTHEIFRQPLRTPWREITQPFPLFVNGENAFRSGVI